MHYDPDIISRIFEQRLGILMPYIPSIVVSNFADDVSPLENPISWGTEPHLTQRETKITHQ